MTDGTGTAWRQKVALVAGGTRGAGLAVARALAARGCRVYVGYAHDEIAAKDAVADLAALPGTVSALRGDVTVTSTLPRQLARLRHDHGRLDVFVHSVASFHRMSAAAPRPDGIRADLTAALAPLTLGARSLKRAMAGGPGRILVVTSNGARRVVPAYVSAGVAKAALEAQVRYLAAELAPCGITVNAVSTAKLDKGTAGEGAGIGAFDADVVRALGRRTPAGRLTTPADVADVAALLCSDEAGWINGQVITADGGLSLLA
ncbi:SDR family oxidoreductase [Streptomyces tagetis]|uniref:SDR family oxidoreductase n=1 Tax=Streptomyces tagetis TaxID=2820809 RepID=A0A940XD91_9ACTN|nr:SDR family oxidoreductase [Streptomyces sp. RG38]MBQ0825062.1 SDR family oxidoreductase [Streptomyces sp. RG38]